MGLPLIVLTSVLHVLGLGLINETVVRALRRRTTHRHSTARFAVAMSLTVLLATVLHALEAALWAAAYLLLGALPDAKTAILYSLSAVTTYGHASALLAVHWRLLGALEALEWDAAVRADHGLSFRPDPGGLAARQPAGPRAGVGGTGGGMCTEPDGAA